MDSTNQTPAPRQPDQTPVPAKPKPLAPARPVDKDAVAFQSDATEIALRPVPMAARTVLYTVLAFVVLAVLWASLGSVDRVITAPGQITTEAPQIVLQPYESALIREINVHPGDIVHKGDVLVKLDPTFVAADNGAVTGHLDALQAQATRLQAELDRKNIASFATDPAIDAQNRQIDNTRRAYVTSELATFDAQLHELNQQLAGAANEAADVKQQVEAEQRITNARQELYNRKVGSLLQLLEAQNTLVGTQRELHRLQSTASDLKAQLATQQQKRAAFIADWRNKAAEELKTAQQDIDKLGHDLSKSARRSDLVQLTAPADAVVLQLAPRSVGSVAREGETLVTLVPLDSPLQISADLDPKDVARVRPGDAVTVKLDAMPFQRYGTIEGTLKVVSQDTVQHTPNDGDPTAPTDPHGNTPPAYRAIIAIRAEKLHDVPADFKLIPGMGVHAEIKIGQRRLISYFLYPLIAAGNESFREP